MASGPITAGGVAIDITADLAPLVRSLAQADRFAQAAGGSVAGKLGGMETAANRAAAAGARLREATDQAAQSAMRFGSAAVAANDNAIRSYARMASALTEVVGVLGRFGVATGGLAGIIGLATGGATAVAGLAAATIAAGDSWTRYANQLQAAGVASSQVQSTQRDLVKLAIETRTSLDATVAIYARMTRATSDLGASQSQVARLVEILNKDLANAGISAGEAAGGLLQFSQALQSGQLGGDELRSVLENMPTIARAIAKEFGVSVGALRDLGSEGKLTADRVFQAVLNAGKDVDAAFAKSVPTISQGVEVAKSGLIALGAEINNSTGLSTLLAEGLAAIGRKANEAAQGVDRLRLASEASRTNNLERRLSDLQETERPYFQSMTIPGRPNTDLERVQTEIEQTRRALSVAYAEIDQRINAMVGVPERALRPMSDELREMERAAMQAASGLNGSASAADNAGAAFGRATVQARGFSDALRLIQSLNPDLAGTIGLLSKMGDVQKAEREGLEGLKKSFQDGNIGEADYRQRMVKLNDEAAASIKALRTESDKPFASYVREAEIGKLDDLGQALARAGDRYADLKKQAEAKYKVEIEAAADPAARGAAEKARAEALGKLDAAYKQVEATTRKNAAEKAAKSAGGGTGVDAFDSALQRSKDQVEEFKLQAETAGKASEEVYRLTEANRLRRAALSAGRDIDADLTRTIDGQAEAYARQRKATDEAIEAQRRFREGQREMAQSFGGFVEDLVSGSGKITDALGSLGKSFVTMGVRGLFTGEGMVGNALGLAPTERGGVGGLFGGGMSLSKLLGGSSGYVAANDTGTSSFFPEISPHDIKEATREGTSGGFIDGLKSIFGSGGGASGAAGNGSLASGFGGVLALGSAYGIGRSTTNTKQAVIGGAVSGAVGGAMLGAQLGAGMGPAGAAVGALVGGGLALFGSNQAKKQAERQKKLEAFERFADALPSIQQLQATLRGDGQGDLRKTIAASQAEIAKAAKIAAEAGQTQLANDLVADGHAFAFRMRQQFMAGFDAEVASMKAGFGQSGPFSTALKGVQATVEKLRGWIGDVADAYAGDENALRIAREAAQAMALSALDGAKELSGTEKRFQEIKGTAAGLQTELVKLGASAEDAARVIEERTNKALDALRTSFADDLDTKINEASGKSYFNDAKDLLKEVASLRADAALIGGNTGDVDRYFRLAAQGIVDGAQLTGDAFVELQARFPELAGQVHEFSEAMTTAGKAAARAAAEARASGYSDRTFAAGNDESTFGGAMAAFERKAQADRLAEEKAGGEAMGQLEQALSAERLKILLDFAKQYEEQEKANAARRLGFQNRVFTALNDSTTLEGQLAAFERQAQQERATEYEAGGQAILELEGALFAERLSLVQKFNQGALATDKQRVEEARTYLDTFARNIRQFVDNLRAGSSSPLSPQARLAAAQSQYDTQLALSRTGDRNALDGITGYANDLLEAGKAFYASSASFQAMFAQVTGQLSSLPSQVSAEQFIVNAITDLRGTLVQSLVDNFGSLDTSLDGLLDFAEFKAGLGPLATQEEQAQARAIFDQIDQNGDGQLSALEVLRSSLLTALQANSPTAIATALTANFTRLDTSVNGLLDQGEFLAGLGPLATSAEQKAAKAIFASIDADGDGQISRLEAINAQTAGVAGQVAANTNVTAAQNPYLDAINAYTRGNYDQTLATNSLIATSNAILNSVNSGVDANRFQTITLNNTMQGVANNTYANYNVSSDLNGKLASIASSSYYTSYNTAMTDGNRNAGAGRYAEGGWVEGPGTGTSDSIAAMLSNGEFVVRASVAQQNRGFLEALNDNGRFAMPAVAVPMPVPMAVGGGDGGAVLAELRQQNALLRQQLAMMQQGNRIAVAASEDNREGLDEVKGAVRDSARAAELLAA